MCGQQSLRSACAYAQSDQSLCKSLEYSMSVKLLTEYNLEYLSSTGGCTGLSESALVKMLHFREITCRGSYNVIAGSGGLQCYDCAAVVSDPNACKQKKTCSSPEVSVSRIGPPEKTFVWFATMHGSI